MYNSAQLLLNDKIFSVQKKNDKVLINHKQQRSKGESHT